MKVQSVGHGLRMVASRAIDMAVLARLSGIEVLKPPVIDFTPAEPLTFWKQSRVLTPYPVSVVDEWTPLEGRAWRSVELAGESSGPGIHPGATRLMASAHIARNPDPAIPTVILVHGYAIPFTGFDRWLAWRIRRRGASTIRIDLPYHLRRTPPGRDSGDGFFSIDPAHTRAVVQQSVEDVAALVAWAREEVSPLVSVMGTSLGGLITVLLAALVDLDGVVAVAPLCDPPASFTMRPPGALQRRLGMLGEGDSYWGRDRRVAKEFLDSALAPLVARNLVPVTPGDRITLVKADNDLIVGPGPVDELAAAWGTDLWRYPQGHITVMNAPGVAGRIVDRVVEVRPAGDTMQLAG